MKKCADCGIKLDEDNTVRFFEGKPNLCYECLWQRQHVAVCAKCQEED